MKTTKVGDTIFHHPTSYKGDVEIIVKPDRIQHLLSNGIVGEHYVVKVPFDDMKRLVFASLRDKLIGIAEESSDEEFEQWLLSSK